MRYQIKILCLGLFIASNLALHITDSEARGRVRLRGSGLHHGANHSGPVMSRNELRTCQTYEKSLNAKLAEIQRLDTDAKEKADTINQLEEEIVQRKKTVDNYSEESVNSYNKMIDNHKKLTEKYNAWIPILNSEVDKYKKSEEGFNKHCANKAYYLDDMDAISAEK